MFYKQLHLKYLCNLARYWLRAPWRWHDSVETCRSVIICELIVIVLLLVIVQNILFVLIGKIFRYINIWRLRTIKKSKYSQVYVHVTRKTRNVSFINHLILSGCTFLTIVLRCTKKHWFLKIVRLRPLVLPYEQRAVEDHCAVNSTGKTNVKTKINLNYRTLCVPCIILQFVNNHRDAQFL